MRQFMTNTKPPVPETPLHKPKPATECGTCTEGRSTGQEDTAPEAPAEGEKKETTVVMSGPFGAAVTEALNKQRAKTAAGMNSGIATESITEAVGANGQFYKPNMVLSRISKAVGMIPKTDDTPTPLNMMLDVAGRVDEMDFVIVNSIEPPVNQAVMPQKSVIHFPSLDNSAALEGYAIEGVQMVVTLRKLK